jgi:hypothetical protein
MRFGPYDDLQEDYSDTKRWLFNAVLGRIAATPQQIGAMVAKFGIIKRLLGRE